MSQFLVGLVERAMLRAPVLERRTRSLYEPIAPTMAGPAVLESEDPMPEALEQHLAPPASRAPRESTREGVPAEWGHRGDASSTAGAPRRTGRSGEAGAAAMPVSDDRPRAAFAALDGSAPDLEVKPDAPVSLSIALAPSEIDDPGTEPGDPAWSAWARPHAPSPAFAAPIAPRDREPAPLVPALASAPPARPRRDQGAETPLPITRRRRRAAGLAGELSGEPPPPAVQAASVDPAALVPAPAAGGGAPAPGALLRSGPRVPGPSALLVQSQRPVDVSRTGAAVAPPPVHVTIGRLEVRAHGPGAERPPARRPAGPKLTLEDYLHGRRGGSR